MLEPTYACASIVFSGEMQMCALAKDLYEAKGTRPGLQYPVDMYAHRGVAQHISKHLRHPLPLFRHARIDVLQHTVIFRWAVFSIFMAVAGYAGSFDAISESPSCSVNRERQLLVALNLRGHE